MRRTLVITRHSFAQAFVQPVFWLIIVLAAAVVWIYGNLPFFTLGDDARMFKSVVLDIVMLFVLVSTLLATSRSIYDEIEDRTMLTLMSKPVGRAQVLLGKYLGIVLASGVAVFLLAVVTGAALWMRVPGDYMLSTSSIFREDIDRLAAHRVQHLLGLAPAMLLIWLQVCVLAAISVAISTRVSFLVNLPVVIVIYLAGNLARFIPATVEALAVVNPDTNVAMVPAWISSIGWVIEVSLPFLAVFDLRDLTVYSTINMPGTMFEGPTTVSLASIWIGTALAGVYAICYSAAALSAGMMLFRSRELGGAEG